MNFLHSIYWQLPVLIVIICLVYSATRFDDWGDIFHETWRWAVRMGGFLLAIGAVLFVLARYIS